jgi:hypothetical protein
MVLLIGGSKSGKSYTLRGNESKEKGIIINTLDDILNLIEIQQKCKNILFKFPLNSC